MKIIRDWNDLKPYGIDLLTGERCAYMQRLLCDVTVEGKKLLGRMLGLRENWSPDNPVFRKNLDGMDRLKVLNVTAGGLLMDESWNAQAGWSVMIPRQWFKQIALFALLTVDKCREVYVAWDGVYGVTEEDEPEKVKLWSEVMDAEAHAPRYIAMHIRCIHTGSETTTLLPGMYKSQYEAEQALDKMTPRRFISFDGAIINYLILQQGTDKEFYRVINPGFSNNRHAMSGRG